jgi:glutamyl-Q tRNA(Asp) synthetase
LTSVLMTFDMTDVFQTTAPRMASSYVGRFAPSPTGPLHAGSLVAALASWLDARAHQGRWLVRLEDTDTPRCVPGAAQTILQQLAACGLHSDGPVLVQSARSQAYQTALSALTSRGMAYACGCTRKEVQDAAVALNDPHDPHGSNPSHIDTVYPGTCRGGLKGKTHRATRLLTLQDQADVTITWHDRRLGAQSQNITREVGDFVLKRADGLWAYQLAVVVDDAHQGITHVVRGLDLANNTPRQIWLQRRLALPTPQYLHTPLVLASDGHKLSKQNGAQALALGHPQAVLLALQSAAATLGLPTFDVTHLPSWLAQAVLAWRDGIMRAAFKPLP